MADRWQAVQQEMKFYCSYSMLTNTPPRTLVVPKPGRLCPVRKMIGEGGDDVNISTFDKGYHSFSLVLLKNINPYQYILPYTSMTNALIRDHDGTHFPPTISEDFSYIIVSYRSPIGNIKLEFRLYKHTRDNLLLTLASMPDYIDQVVETEEGDLMGTICYFAAKKYALYRRPPQNPCLVYNFTKTSDTVCSISPDDIADSIMARLKNKTSEQRQLIYRRIEEMHTPLHIPRLDPYTRHGTLPIEYERIWSFIHCCRDELPKCEFTALCREIGDLYFLMSERNIEKHFGK